MKKGVELMNHWMTNVKADKAIYDQTVKQFWKPEKLLKKIR
jgi:hypothetical protein